MNITVESLVNAHCACGENPLYDDRGHRVLWTDIPNGRLFELDLSTGDWRQFYDGSTVGGFTLQADGSLLLFRENNIARLDADGSVQVLADDLFPQTGRFNDVLAAPDGTVFAGTMGRDGLTGGLFHLQRNGDIAQLWDGTECANGMGFSPDGTRFYWTDSGAKIIYVCDYDRTRGQVANRRELVVCTPEMKVPDGMTVDANGDLWSAFWDGSCLRRFSPNGALQEEIALPVAKVSSCVFGGKNLDELFVTTAGGRDDAETPDGTLYRLHSGVRGLPENRSHIWLD